MIRCIIAQNFVHINTIEQNIMLILNVAARIKEERERLGFSQIAFAGVAEATRNSQLNWEKGSAMPNAAVLAAWAKVGADVLYIVTGQHSVDITETLSASEQVLLSSYRAAPEPVRNAALAVLLSGGQAPEGVDTSKERKGRAAPKNVKQVNMGNNGINISGGVNIKGGKE